jgi:hypothetical protein
LRAAAARLRITGCRIDSEVPNEEVDTIRKRSFEIGSILGSAHAEIREVVEELPKK